MSIIFLTFVFVSIRLTQKSSDLQNQIQPSKKSNTTFRITKAFFKQEECCYAIHLSIGTLPLKKKD